MRHRVKHGIRLRAEFEVTYLRNSAARVVDLNYSSLKYSFCELSYDAGEKDLVDLMRERS